MRQGVFDGCFWLNSMAKTTSLIGGSITSLTRSGGRFFYENLGHSIRRLALTRFLAFVIGVMGSIERQFNF
jgi:hypothetical protein